jgi:oligoribonuclease
LKDSALDDPRFLFVDVETTGLNDASPGGLHDGGLLLEVCLLLTRPDLDYLDHRSAVIYWGDMAPWRARVAPAVEAMHAASGLWDECSRPGWWRTTSWPGGIPSKDAEAMFLTWLQQWDVKPGTQPMCGSSVQTDRDWLKGRMPNLAAWFHYRNIDVSTIKEVSRRWFPGTVRRATAEPRGMHRAYPDLLDTIDEFTHYRAHVFRPAEVRA